MIVGQGNDPPSKFAQMLALQQQVGQQQGFGNPYVTQSTGTAPMDAYYPQPNFQPQQPQQIQQQGGGMGDDWVDPGIYGPTSQIGRDIAGEQQGAYTAWGDGQMSDSGGFYGPTSQMAADMGTGPGPSQPQNPQGQLFPSNEQMQQQNIDYYKQALQNMLQQMQGGGQSAGVGAMG